MNARKCNDSCCKLAVASATEKYFWGKNRHTFNYRNVFYTSKLSCFRYKYQLYFKNMGHGPDGLNEVKTQVHARRINTFWEHWETWAVHFAVLTRLNRERGAFEFQATYTSIPCLSTANASKSQSACRGLSASAFKFICKIRFGFLFMNITVAKVKVLLSLVK